MKPITRAAAYADSDDFRQIFDESMNSLYRLAFLLTANHGKAEQCFVQGLGDVVGGNPVFKKWAHSWARRVIIQNAVRPIKPRPNNGSGRSRSASLDSDYQILPVERHVEISAVPCYGAAHGGTFSRRALEQIGRQVEMPDRQLSNVRAQDPGLRDGSGFLIESMAVPPFVTSA